MKPENSSTPTTPVDPRFGEIVQRMKDMPNYLIFMVGDSLTEGIGVPDRKNLDFTAKFTEKLAKLIPEKNVYRIDGVRTNHATAILYPEEEDHVQIQKVEGTTDEIAVARCGIGGNTVKRIINRSTDYIGKELRGRTGDLFIIMSGINDSAVRNEDKYAAPPVYKEHLNTLLDMISAEHKEADFILMTPTYAGQNGRTLDVYADEMKAVAKERNIPLIDQHKLWLDHWVEGAEHCGQGDWLSEGDSCHPTAVGYEAMADEMIRCVFGVKPE
ncbi:MAG: hypothetical protein IKB02_04000 [Clostridia bacterium]|nr:hypothetical protein [Clostridia bacterium]